MNSLYIANSTFKKNRASNGGAIYIEDGQRMVLDHNYFTENLAKPFAGKRHLSGLGGAIYYSCLSKLFAF